MFNLASSLRAAVRASPLRLSAQTHSLRLRSFQSSSRALKTDFSDSPPPTSSPRKSASDAKEGNPEKVSDDQIKETEEQMGGDEMKYGQYGAAGLKEGNFTDESKEGKERKGAAKQGEK
ncbi:uncharacterized protein JCM6883_006027 [Sporobolomyces salmoneus]|uniref:uncharacterized protein n=1 Tax=Sporobolomyces salmoneus TaxID=183962 RepID=UPI003173EB84